MVVLDVGPSMAPFLPHAIRALCTLLADKVLGAASCFAYNASFPSSAYTFLQILAASGVTMRLTALNACCAAEQSTDARDGDHSARHVRCGSDIAVVANSRLPVRCCWDQMLHTLSPKHLSWCVRRRHE